MGEKYIEDILAENVRKYYCSSYDDLKKYHVQMLTEITENAHRSPVYRDRVRKVETLEQLADIPLTIWKDVEDATEKAGLESALLARPARYWQTSGYSGKPKQVHYGAKDIDAMHMSIMEMLYITGAFETEMAIWNIGVAEPYLPGTLFDDCFMKYRPMARTKVSYYSETATDQDGFVKTMEMISEVRGVNILIAFPVVYYLIAMSSSRPEWLENKVVDAFCRLMVLPFRVLPAACGKAFAKFYLRKIDNRHIGDVIGNATTGYVFGESLDPYQPFIGEHYPRAAFFDILGSTEMLVQAFDVTPGADALSVALKNFIPEIATVEDVEAAKSDPQRRLKATPWYEWEKGMRGELIITRPGECLPLIRYPTGDYVEVVDPARKVTVTRDGAKYDITLPAIRVLSRTMDMVDFEAPDQSGSFFGFKFYSKNLSDAMARAGNVRWWEFYKLHGSPGRYMIWVVPETEVDDEEAFRKKILAALLDEHEDHAVSFSLARELDVLEVVVARPGAYGDVERAIERRIKEHQPLGRIKPRHIYSLGDEQEFDRIVAEKKKRA